MDFYAISALVNGISSSALGIFVYLSESGVTVILFGRYQLKGFKHFFGAVCSWSGPYLFPRPIYILS